MNWLTRRPRKKSKKYFETNENENTTAQNLGGIAKAILRLKFMPLKVYFEKQKNSNEQSKLIVKGTRKPQVSIREEIIKIRAELNVTQSKNTKNE